MDLFPGNPDEDSMIGIEPWLPEPGTSGFDDPAGDAMLPSASPLPSLPGALTLSQGPFSWRVCKLLYNVVFCLCAAALPQHST